MSIPSAIFFWLDEGKKNGGTQNGSMSDNAIFPPTT